MGTTGSANDQITELMKNCLKEKLQFLIDHTPMLKTNPKLEAIFKAGYWQGAEAYVDFLQLIMTEGQNNGVVSEGTEQSE